MLPHLPDFLLSLCLAPSTPPFTPSVHPPRLFLGIPIYLVLLTLLLLFPCLLVSVWFPPCLLFSVSSFPTSASIAKSFSVCSCQFPFIFLHLSHCPWLPLSVSFDFSLPLVVSTHLVYNSCSINTGGCLFSPSISLLPTHYADFFLIYIPILHFFLTRRLKGTASRPPSRDVYPGCLCQPSPAGLDCWPRRME